MVKRYAGERYSSTSLLCRAAGLAGQSAKRFRVNELRYLEATGTRPVITAGDKGRIGVVGKDSSW